MKSLRNAVELLEKTDPGPNIEVKSEVSPTVVECMASVDDDTSTVTQPSGTILILGGLSRRVFKLDGKARMFQGKMP